MKRRCTHGKQPIRETIKLGNGFQRRNGNVKGKSKLLGEKVNSFWRGIGVSDEFSANELWSD